MAAEKGKFFNVYLDHFKAVLELSDKKRGQLVAALILYAETGQLTESYIGLERVCYDTLRDDIDRSIRNYRKICERNQHIARTRSIPPLARMHAAGDTPLSCSPSPAKTSRDQSSPVVTSHDESSPVVTNSNSNSNSNTNTNTNNNSNSGTASLPGGVSPDASSLFDQILRGDEHALNSFRTR